MTGRDDLRDRVNDLEASIGSDAPTVAIVEGDEEPPAGADIVIREHIVPTSWGGS